VKLLDFHPVTPDRWPDLDRLFSESAGEELGNPSRCWCMEWRLASHREWREGAGEANRQGMRRRVAGGDVPGIIGYVDGEPAGWCSVSPKPSLIGFRQLKDFPQSEDPAVWSVICFYVPEAHRGQGLMGRLLSAAVEYAAASGAHVVEGIRSFRRRRRTGRRDDGCVRASRVRAVRNCCQGGG
jgi:GNAT superfamily N-acetyltransferase